MDLTIESTQNQNIFTFSKTRGELETLGITGLDVRSAVAGVEITVGDHLVARSTATHRPSLARRCFCTNFLGKACYTV